MKAEGTVGTQAVNDGALVPVRMDRLGAQTVSELQARYAEQAIRGLTMLAANQAAQAVSVALATTYTGLCLSNTAGSGKNLVLKTVSVAETVAPAAIASLHLIGGFGAVTHTTPVTPRSTLLGVGAVGVGLADSAATIPTPVYLLPLIGGFTAAALPSPAVGVIDLGGQIIVPPGAFVAVGALTAVTGFFGFVWDEVPV